jgi:hypothetical protein
MGSRQSSISTSSSLAKNRIWRRGGSEYRDGSDRKGSRGGSIPTASFLAKY